MWRWIDGLALADVEKKAAAQLDAVKIAASVAVAAGGLFALYLAARRQRTQEEELKARHAELAQRDRVQAHVEYVAETNRLHAERVAAATERDAEARRVTELYGKGVEQLGSDKAPVRLGGLYALERLAQDNPERPELRQTVVNVVCAYLRMPFEPPTDPPGPDSAEDERAGHRDRVQEREVRLTAQRVLRDHLRPGDDPDNPAATFWSDIDLDLTGATLVNLDLSHCRSRRTVFTGATFAGNAGFAGATFAGNAGFVGARFGDYALFAGVTFAGHAGFDQVTFTEPARFAKATFGGAARFTGAKFGGVAWFDAATFAGDARFTEATFAGHAMFTGARFSMLAWFDQAMFAGHAGFDQVTFTESARFDQTMFAGLAGFEQARFIERVEFDKATFARDLRFDEAEVSHVAVADRWRNPPGWRLVGEDRPLDGLDGTWHRLVRTDSGPAGTKNPSAGSAGG
uniref:pentapeptide repeat-containing protein n=1 Tax=Saccharothrix espanaensis TaxID=103731 RepID=UPI003F495093